MSAQRLWRRTNFRQKRRCQAHIDRLEPDICVREILANTTLAKFQRLRCGFRCHEVGPGEHGFLRGYYPVPYIVR